MDILFPDEFFEEYAWDTLLLQPINAGCLAYIIQTSDIYFMMKTFARLFHSPKSMNRNNRKYLYLPETYVDETDFNSSIKELYESMEISFMPDLVIARVMHNDNIKLEMNRSPFTRGTVQMHKIYYTVYKINLYSLER